MPGDIGRDESTERRADQRTDQRRQGDPDHGVDQLAPVNAAHQNEAPNGRHHRSTHALEDARQHELVEGTRDRAADRAEHEHGDRRAKHRARAETIGGPTAERDEDRKREQVGGDRELERERARADVGGDCRQRGRNDG